MTPGSGLHLKTFFLLFIMVVFGPLGDVLLSKGMKDLGEIPNWSPAELAHLFVGVFTSGMIWLGILSLIGFFIAYTLVLSWADYSFVQPASVVFICDRGAARPFCARRDDHAVALGRHSGDLLRRADRGPHSATHDEDDVESAHAVGAEQIAPERSS